VLALTLWLLAAPPAPGPGPGPFLADAPTAVSPGLAQARKLADDLRFEEAVVEYQRYLGDASRPPRERARALFELAVLHQVLADPVSALKRAVEALELDPSLQLPPGTPAKQVALLEEARKQVRGRVKVDLIPRDASEPPSRVRAKMSDPDHRAKAVLLRHALASEGPYWSSPMNCRADQCAGDLPQEAASAYTAWYYVEANDANGNTLARAAGPGAPMQVVVQIDKPWFSNPLVWVGATALLVGAASVAYVATSPTPAR
jgi:hypothetical protein